MPCCPLNTFNFINATQTTIPYAGEFGDKPLVDVMYLIDGEWIAKGVFTNIYLLGFPTSSIKVDHGGPATGVIKLS